MNPEKRYELARVIVETIAAYEAKQLKRGARDYLTGMIQQRTVAGNLGF